MDLLRFITAGSVDDGKSTLIGRLLYDSKAIMEDQLAAIEEASSRRGEEGLNLALLTDGLKAEREQGITIDVAYRYFNTPRRKFIIADCPGHVQYTRNMVTGASGSSLAVLLVDARKGLQEQTRRHSLIASLLRIPHLVICVNKMDLVDYSREAFESVRKQFSAFSKKLEIQDVTFIPISALKGDNVVEESTNTPWYKGRTLLNQLEEVHIASDTNHIDLRLPVQMVTFSRKAADFRGYAGTVASGMVRVGDEVTALPSGFTTRVKSITAAGSEITEATANTAVMITLEDEIDISRGDMLVRPRNRPDMTQDLEAMICWMDTQPLNVSRKYLIRQTTADARCAIKELTYKIDINSLSRISADSDVALNEFVRAKIRVSKPLLVDSYRVNPITGSFILVDEDSCATVAAGMVL